jgi:hypothetical protein
MAKLSKWKTPAYLMAERINEGLARRAKIVELPLPEKDALLQELLSPKDEAHGKKKPASPGILPTLGAQEPPIRVGKNRDPLT